MSNIALVSPATGTATFSITTPSGTSTDRTLTLPDNSGTLVTNTSGSVSQSMLASGVAGTGPAFSAYQSSAQSLTANTITKIQLQTEEFDTASCFDSTTNYRFTPNVAGYYQVNGGFVASSSGRSYNVIYIYKNGVQVKTGQAGNSTTGVGSGISVLIYLNGTTDYVELYGLSGLSQNTSANLQETWFQAFLARAA
jgi:hypothetical protein